MAVSAHHSPAAGMSHRHPPVSPSGLVRSRPWVAPVLLTTMLALALAAGLDGGRLLLHVDLPIAKRVLADRTTGLDEIFSRISFLGSTTVVLAGGAVLALLALPRCRVVAAFIAVATLVRGPYEHVLKLVVDRSRPDLSRLVNGEGPSFPSGHVLASAVLWFSFTMVVSLYLPSRRLWWTVTTISVIAVFLIGCSRVYLGVHWPSDVVGGFVGGLLLLAALDRLYLAVHARRCCDFRHVRSAPRN